MGDSFCEVHRCLFCFEVCSVKHAEIALLNCSSCNELYGHMHCIIKRTSPRQRVLLQSGAMCHPPVICPRVVETGVCGCPLNNLRILKDNHDFSRKNPKTFGSSFQSYTLCCRGLPPEISESNLRLYFEQYGYCSCLIIPSESDEQLEAFITFTDINSLLKALDEDHTIDGENQLVVEPTFDVERHRQKQRSKQEKRRVENCVQVGPFPDQVSEAALLGYFEDFGVIVDVDMPTKGRGFADVYFLDTDCVDAVLSVGGHCVDGIPVTARKLHSRGERDNSGGSRRSGGRVRKINAASPWSIAQRSNSTSAAEPERSMAAPPATGRKKEENLDEDGDEDLQRALDASLALAHAQTSETDDEDAQMSRALLESVAVCGDVLSDIDFRSSQREVECPPMSNSEENMEPHCALSGGEGLCTCGSPRLDGRAADFRTASSMVDSRLIGGDSHRAGTAPTNRHSSEKAPHLAPGIPAPRDGSSVPRYTPLQLAGADGRAQGGKPAAEHLPLSSIASGVSTSRDWDSGEAGLDEEERALLSLLLCGGPGP